MGYQGKFTNFRGKVALLLLLVIAAAACSQQRSERRQRQVLRAEPAFDLKQPMIQTAHYSPLVAKLTALAGADARTISETLRTQKTQLGDYHLATGIAPSLVWNEQKMKIWLQAMREICEAPQVRRSYPWTTGTNAFIRKAYGRVPTSTEQDLIKEINANRSISPDDRFDVFCIAILGSLEFVAR